ncbi:MAG: transporter [Bacteroidetes bacterium HGW-Bacteroidetes-7]|jgi:outer membrane protein TolC|nr:MAG: transporter [Bacteroidetes bacterium HGW-Bacteroidetes-7]
MKKFFGLISFLMILTLSTLKGQTQESQRVYTIEECQALAAENYPAIKRFTVIETIKELKIKNLNTLYLPQGGINIKASYQSDVTSIPVNIPGMTINPLSKDQYSATLNVEQLIWDGGVTGAAKRQVIKESEIGKNELESELYSVREMVNELYFGILLNERYLQDIKLVREDLLRILSRAEALVSEGMANRSDTDAISAELITLNQRETELKSGKESLISMLSLLTGSGINPDSEFREPSGAIPDVEIFRPELKIFESKSDFLQIKKEQTLSQRRPKIGAFLQAGYGKPGLNMLKDEFSPFFVTGIKLSWNIGSLYSKNNEIRILDREMMNINSHRETFLLNISLKSASQRSAISKIEKLLESDNEVIELRERLVKAAEVKLENGIISVTDYLRELNNLDIARGNKRRHNIELILAIYTLKHTHNQ